jgi:PAS domain-containing protein
MEVSPNKYTADRAAHGLRLRFIGALVAIGALVVLSQIAIQWLLAGQQDDVRVIGVAARQATLSQGIAKTASRLISIGSTEARRSAIEELRESLQLFQRSHSALQQGDPDQGLPGNNSSQVRLMYSGIESDFQAIVTAGGILLTASDNPTALHQAVQRLNQHESSFLAGMNEIVNQYQAETRSRVTISRWLQAACALLILATLVLVANKIVAPTVARVQKDMEQHERQAAEADKTYSASPTALFMIDAASLAILRGNRKAEVLMGCPADDFVGHPFSAFFETSLDANRTFLQKVRAGEIFDEHEVILTDARKNVVNALASLRHIAQGSRRAYLIGITDVTGSQS